MNACEQGHVRKGRKDVLGMPVYKARTRTFGFMTNWGSQGRIFKSNYFTN